MRVTSFDKKLTKLYSALQALFEHHKDKKSSVDAFKVARTSTDSAANLILAELEKIAALAEAGKNDLSKSFSSVVRELISVHKDKLGKVKGMHSEVIRFSVSGDSSDQTRKKQVQDSLSKSKAEIDQLDASIESLISKLR